MAHTEIAVQSVHPEPPDLHRQRVQQTHGLQTRLDLRLGHFFVVGKVALYRHQPQQAEHERHDDEQRQDGAPDAFCEILHHGGYTSLFFLKSDIYRIPQFFIFEK